MTQIGERITVDPDGCWRWTGPTNDHGYPQGPRRDDGQPIRIHRLIYETLMAPIPDGHHVHHLCAVRRCVNPEHLEAMAPGDHRREHA